MTKEKIISLNKYLSNLNDRINDKVVPEKHKGHPDTYRAFLAREIDMVKRQLEEAKLEGISK